MENQENHENYENQENHVNQEEHENQGKHRKKRIVILLLLLLMLMGAASYILFSNQGFQFDTAAEDGNLKGMSAAQLQELMNDKVDESMLEVSINNKPQFKNSDTAGSLRIENSARNRYNMVVEIVKDDDQSVIYQSKGIKPGQMIENDKLDVQLEKGVYPCTATFKAFDTEKNTEVGEAAAKLQIEILE